MTQISAKGGHTPLGGVGHAGFYLEFQKGDDGRRLPERGERALAHDFINISERNGRAGVPWYDQMDLTRQAYGNDVAKAGKGSRPLTYVQYIISPDPRDDCDLPKLRDLTMEWARKWFSDYQVAVVYHDDNGAGILHAHVIVNNTNLETGRRLGPYLTKARVQQINQSMQELSLAYGLRAYDSEHESRTRDEMREAGTDLERTEGSPHASRKGERAKVNRRWLKVEESKTETVIRAEGGRPWKADLRDAIDCALAIAANEAEFLAALRAVGVDVTESRNRRLKGKPDWVFHHPSQRAEGNKRECRGSRLGDMYSRRNLERVFALGYANMRQAASMVDGPVAPLDARTRHNIIRGLEVVGVARPGSTVTLKQVTELLAFNKRNKVEGYADYEALSDSKAKEMASLARELGMFDWKTERLTREGRRDAMTMGDYLASRDKAGAGGYEKGRKPGPTKGGATKRPDDHNQPDRSPARGHKR